MGSDVSALCANEDELTTVCESMYVEGMPKAEIIALTEGQVTAMMHNRYLHPSFYRSQIDQLYDSVSEDEPLCFQAFVGYSKCVLRVLHVAQKLQQQANGTLEPRESPHSDQLRTLDERNLREWNAMIAEQTAPLAPTRVIDTTVPVRAGDDLRTPGFLAASNNTVENGLDPKFKAVLLMAGHSDLEDHSVEDIVSRIKRLHTACHESGKRTILFLLPQSLKSTSIDGIRKKRLRVNFLLQEWAKYHAGKILAVVDTGSLMPYDGGEFWEREGDRMTSLGTNVFYERLRKDLLTALRPNVSDTSHMPFEDSADVDGRSLSRCRSLQPATSQRRLLLGNATPMMPHTQFGSHMPVMIPSTMDLTQLPAQIPGPTSYQPVDTYSQPDATHRPLFHPQVGPADATQMPLFHPQAGQINVPHTPLFHPQAGQINTPQTPLFHPQAGQIYTPQTPLFHPQAGQINTPQTPLFHPQAGQINTPQTPLFHPQAGQINATQTPLFHPQAGQINTPQTPLFHPQVGQINATHMPQQLPVTAHVHVPQPSMDMTRLPCDVSTIARMPVEIRPSTVADLAHAPCDLRSQLTLHHISSMSTRRSLDVVLGQNVGQTERIQMPLT